MAIKNYFRSTGSWAKQFAIISVFVAAGGLLGSCGGGGVASNTTVGGALQVQPGSADVFADVPTEFTVSGGTAPYVPFTSNNVVIPVPAISGSKFTVIARSVAADTPVAITVRDNVGASAATNINVRPTTLNNIVTITPVAPSGTGCGTGLCSGGDARVVVTAIVNGIKLTNRPIRFDVFQGDFRFVTPGTNVQVTSLIVNTDENGEAVARLTAIVTAPTQVATLTTTDTVTGLLRRANFNIIQTVSGVGILTSLPSGNTTFTGGKPGVGQPAQCPFGGIVDYYVYGGTPPYVITTPLPQFLSVSPSIVITNGGSFRVTQNGCGTSQLIVTDAQNRVIETSQVIGALGPAGDAPTPPTPTTVAATPDTLTLVCGETGTSALSGSGTYTASVTTSGINSAAFTVTPTSGAIPGSISFTRVNAGNIRTTPAAAGFTNVVVNLVAGATAALVTVNVPNICP